MQPKFTSAVKCRKIQILEKNPRKAISDFTINIFPYFDNQRDVIRAKVNALLRCGSTSKCSIHDLVFTLVRNLFQTINSSKKSHA